MPDKTCRTRLCGKKADAVTLEGCWKCGKISEYYHCREHYDITNFVSYCLPCNRGGTTEILARVYERDGWVQQWL